MHVCMCCSWVIYVIIVVVENKICNRRRNFKVVKYPSYSRLQSAHILYVYAYYTWATAKREKKRRHVGHGGSDVCRGAYLMAVYSRGETIYILTSFVRARVHGIIRPQWVQMRYSRRTLKIYERHYHDHWYQCTNIYIYYTGTRVYLCVFVHVIRIYIHVSNIYKQRICIVRQHLGTYTGGKRYYSSSTHISRIPTAIIL